jgi:hypothetical protein
LPSIKEYGSLFVDNQELKSEPKEEIKEEDKTADFSALIVSFSNGDSNHEILRKPP